MRRRLQAFTRPTPWCRGFDLVGRERWSRFRGQSGGFATLGPVSSASVAGSVPSPRARSRSRRRRATIVATSRSSTVSLGISAPSSMVNAEFDDRSNNSARMAPIGSPVSTATCTAIGACRGSRCARAPLRSARWWGQRFAKRLSLGRAFLASTDITVRGLPRVPAWPTAACRGGRPGAQPAASPTLSPWSNTMAKISSEASAPTNSSPRRSGCTGSIQRLPG
jgi:hypothetical protein